MRDFDLFLGQIMFEIKYKIFQKKSDSDITSPKANQMTLCNLQHWSKSVPSPQLTQLAGLRPRSEGVKQ